MRYINSRFTYLLTYLIVSDCNINMTEATQASLEVRSILSPKLLRGLLLSASK